MKHLKYMKLSNDFAYFNITYRQNNYMNRLKGKKVYQVKQE